MDNLKGTGSATAEHDWRSEAVCATAEPELFFPDESGHRARRQAEAAKRLCGMCAVRARCLKESLDNREPYGVWGGLDEDERRELLARRAQPNRQAVGA